ncbi:MAG: hypothetical protein ACI3YH_08580 [Eubacteriales bacterium]
MNAPPQSNDLLRAKYQKNQATGRVSLIAIVIATIVSMLTLAVGNFYFVFSAYLPFSYFTEGWFGWQIANGTYAYMDELSADVVTYYTDLGNFGLILGIVVTLIGVLGYFICWLLSKKHPVALTVGAVFFAIDCAVLLLDVFTTGDISMLLDILLHAYIMYTLIAAVMANRKLKKLPAPALPIEGEATAVTEATTATEAREIPTAGYLSQDQNDSSEQN